MKETASMRGPDFAFRLNAHSGVPVYRQLIDQVLSAVALGTLRTGDQLPTVRQVAVDLAINPNTVMRAYREMEIRGILDTQQGAGTFVAEQATAAPQEERERQLAQLAGELVSRAGSLGFTLEELIETLRDLQQDGGGKRRKS
ncbi:MAG TPA: GntR family transcriptional regulator [Acidobacteriaceae bacterium]|jgi:GntR family transcriptional regulator|nr:GntR family transcriptional regulator [Acidobacteriaceae bacterium]